MQFHTVGAATLYHTGQAALADVPKTKEVLGSTGACHGLGPWERDLTILRVGNLRAVDECFHHGRGLDARCTCHLCRVIHKGCAGVQPAGTKRNAKD